MAVVRWQFTFYLIDWFVENLIWWSILMCWCLEEHAAWFYFKSCWGLSDPFLNRQQDFLDSTWFTWTNLREGSNCVLKFLDRDLLTILLKIPPCQASLSTDQGYIWVPPMTYWAPRNLFCFSQVLSFGVSRSGGFSSMGFFFTEMPWCGAFATQNSNLVLKIAGKLIWNGGKSSCF